MMTPEEKGSLPIRVEKLFYELQDRIFSDIVRRIRKTKKITSTADYQINKLLLLGGSTEFIESQLKELLEISDPEIWELYDQVCDWEYVRNRAAYEQINGNFTPLEDNETIRKWSNAIVKQTQNEIRNLTQSMGMTVDMGGGKVVFTPLATYYQKYLDRACMDIVTGSFDYNTVLRRVVKELSASGLQTIDYASGWKNRAPVAARRAILTGVSQLSAQINEQVAKDLNTDKYEVSWHAGHRPSHWWGGRVYTYQELQSICGLGDGDGLCGWNCRHSYCAFLEGFSVRTYTDEQLAAMEEKEQTVRTYQGKQYNAYQASQAQRQMETTMRAQRTKVRQLQQGDGSNDDILAAKARYLNTLHQYQAFSRKMELPEQMERVYMDGLGRVITDNRIKGMFPQKMVDNMQKDLNQYKRYKEVLGDSIGSLAKFGQMKYNDSEMWKFLQLDYERQKELKSHPELKLPNLENLVVSDTKFTKYLFGGENERGLAKGKAFSDRLGYDLGNWKELQKEICERAGRYPAYYRDNNGYGDRYEQKIIIYGKKGMPANVVVGWMARQDDTTSMSSTYIKEIKK